MDAKRIWSCSVRRTLLYGSSCRTVRWRQSVSCGTGKGTATASAISVRTTQVNWHERCQVPVLKPYLASKKTFYSKQHWKKCFKKQTSLCDTLTTSHGATPLRWHILFKWPLSQLEVSLKFDFDSIFCAKVTSNQGVIQIIRDTFLANFRPPSLLFSETMFWIFAKVPNCLIF